MKTRIPHQRRIDYQNSLEDRRALSLYLQAGRFRKKSGFQELDDPVKKRRLLLYCIAGLFFGVGLFFVLF